MQSNDHIGMPACIAQDSKEAKAEESRMPNRGVNNGEKEAALAQNPWGYCFWEELGLTIRQGSHQCPKALFGYCFYVSANKCVILTEAYRGCLQPCPYLFDMVSSDVPDAECRLILTHGFEDYRLSDPRRQYRY